MRWIHGAFALTLLALPGRSQADPPEPPEPYDVIVRYREPGNDVAKLEVWATDIRPNASSIHDRYRVFVGGHEVTLPGWLIHRLDTGRNGFSHYRRLPLIGNTRKSSTVCHYPRMGKASWVLEVPVLRYDRDWSLLGHELRPVLSDGHCGVRIYFRPRRRAAFLRLHHYMVYVDLAEELCAPSRRSLGLPP